MEKQDRAKHTTTDVGADSFVVDAKENLKINQKISLMLKPHQKEGISFMWYGYVSFSPPPPPTH